MSSCVICGGSDFKLIYEGAVRDGAYGTLRHGASIDECMQCGVQKLAEKDCTPASYYETGQYREILKQSLVISKAVLEQDDMQRFTLDVLGSNTLRNMSMLDVGCGVGSLLDMTRSISGSQIGIEPCAPYLESLTKRGYRVFPSLSDAVKDNVKGIDWAFSIQVIEHVDNPREFLEEILSLLKPGGKVLISTPNRNDILMSLLKEEFPSFFYRTQHRWYFNDDSLSECAELAGFEVINIHYIHRYGLANTLLWLKEKSPKGRNKMPGIDSMADHFWKGYLENNKQSDTIYIELKAPEND